MSANREVGKTDDLRLQGLLTGGGAGSYMYNYGPSGTPNNLPPTPFEQGLTRGPVSQTGMSDAQIQSLVDQRLNARAFGMDDDIDLPDQGDDPFETGEYEDTVFDILMDVMMGTQGNIEGLEPETIAVLRDVLDGSSDEELREVAQEILEAGGWEEWLEQNVEYGDPGGQEPDTPLEEEPYEVDPNSDVDNEYDPEFPVETDEDAGGGGGGSTEGEEGGENQEVDINEDDTTREIDDGADNLPDDKEDDDYDPYPWFEVDENGVVTIPDLENGGRIVVGPDVYGPYIGENPAPGTYGDNGTPIDVETGIIVEDDDDDVVFDPETTPDFPGGDAPTTPEEGGDDTDVVVVPDDSDSSGANDDNTTGGDGEGDADGEGTGDGSGDGSGTGTGSGSGSGSGVGAGIAAGLAGMLTGGASKPGGTLQSNYRIKYETPEIQELIDMRNNNTSARKALDGLLTMLKGTS